MSTSPRQGVEKAIKKSDLHQKIGPGSAYNEQRMPEIPFDEWAGQAPCFLTFPGGTFPSVIWRPEPTPAKGLRRFKRRLDPNKHWTRSAFDGWVAHADGSLYIPRGPLAHESMVVLSGQSIQLAQMWEIH